MTIKKFIRRNLPEIYLLSVLITVLSIQGAYEIRGYLAFGGEVLIPLLPVILHMWVKLYEEE